jgi:DNA polymerase-4
LTRLCRDCFWTAEGEGPPRCPVCDSPRVVSHDELHRLQIAHLDCDAFYATVEKRDRPHLRDEPVIVGGGARGVVTTCCYIARTYGVQSAMPMFKALKACPQATVIKPDFAKYRAESRRIMTLLEALTPLVQPLSLDEAWLDLSGTERLNGGVPAVVLARLQARIERDTGLTVSIGLAPNKFLAKIASELDKPRGFSVIGAEEARLFLAPRPVSILPGVGPAFTRALERKGFRTVGDLARTEAGRLAADFGSAGLRLADLAQGRDAREVDADQQRKSISAETTFQSDLSQRSALEDQLWPLCEKVALRARAEGVSGRVVVLKLKTAAFKITTRRCTLATPTQTARNLFSASRGLLAAEPVETQAYRLIGVGLCDLREGAGLDHELFGADEAKAQGSEKAVDRLRARFGDNVVLSGRSFRRRAEEQRGAPGAQAPRPGPVKA